MILYLHGFRFEGSDHGISEFAQYVDEVLAFCGIQTGVHA